VTQAPPILAAGRGEFPTPDPDAFRDFVREHKDRRLITKLVSEHEAISSYVDDGD